jgi:putative ABC transport system permease protein
MLQDIRFAGRALFRKPLIAALAIVTLALGIGGTTAVFTVVETVLLRPLSFAEPERLVRMWEVTRDGDRFSFSAPNYLDLRAQSRTLEATAAYSEVAGTTVLTGRGEPQRITAVPVSASLGDVLGVPPQIGRMFSPDEDRAGNAERYVVLSDGLWRSRFGGDSQIAGRVVALDGKPHVVTGVMPPRFDFPGGADAWVPLNASAQSERDNKDLAVIGRLGPGATLAQLRGDLRDIARRLSDAYPRANAGWSADAVPFGEWIVAPRFREGLWVLFGAVGLLLMLACANVANLLIAQAVSRHNEIRIRAALGATRGRLVRQLFTESTLLAVLGTAAGLFTAVWSIDLLRSLGGGRVPRLDELQLDASMLAVACVTGAVSCLVFGLAPAVHAARVDLRSSLDEGVRYTIRGSSRLRNGLVVLEVALALLLVVGAGLLANSFVRLVNLDTRFDTANTIAIPLELPDGRYPDSRVASFYTELLGRVRALPGVIDAAATSTNPFRQFGFSNNLTPEERAAAAPPTGLVQAGWRSVTPRFFEAMGVPVLSGRTFADSDRDGAERVVVVSASLAQRLWPGESAIGKRIYWGGTTGRTRTVVGVSGDLRDVQLEAAPALTLFLPHAQVDLRGMTVVVRSGRDLAALAPELRAVLRDLDPLLAAPSIQAVAESHAALAAGPRFNLSLLGAFAIIALVLAVTGVYAVLAFTVAERRREIAVRVALGATGPNIARLVLRNGLGLTAVGVAAGSVAALGATRVLSGLLYDVAPTDPLTFASAAGVLLLVAAMASYLPARQASRIDAIAALRE